MPLIFNKLKLIWILTSVLFWIIIIVAGGIDQLGLVGKEKSDVYKEVSNYIQQNSKPEDSIFVNMYAPWIYGVSHRKSAADIFLGGYVQVEYNGNFGYNFAAKVTNDLQVHKPKFFLQVKPGVIGYSDNPVTTYINQNSTVIGTYRELELRTNSNYSN